jgi:hypothetical protein
MAITDNEYWALLNHATQTIESHILHGTPFLTDEASALVIAFATHRIASTENNHCHEVNDSWQDVEEAYSLKVS